VKITPTGVTLNGKLILSDYLSKNGKHWVIAVRWLGDNVLKRHFWLLPVRDLLSFAIWCVSLVGKQVEWRGRIFEVKRDGRMVERI